MQAFIGADCMCSTTVLHSEQPPLPQFLYCRKAFLSGKENLDTFFTNFSLVDLGVCAVTHMLNSLTIEMPKALFYDGSCIRWF